MTDAPRVAYTVGHSTRALDELVALLRRHGVEAVADVRRVPRSRRHPHFRDDALAAALPEAGVRYVPFPALGGLRKPLPAAASPNGGWRNDSFRGYADYMQTPPFAEALAALETLAAATPTAIMCAEAVHWRCHRTLVADALVARGWRVLHITDDKPPTPHEIRPFAKVDGTRLTYPPEEAELPLFDASC